ncbi:hypothetical protein [Burkholderia sp. PR2]|uniref:hypothetical protein n=1 Tax=Burkholderia sp. PR2 TaxID=3448078 RepID=UPI00402AEB10
MSDLVNDRSNGKSGHRVVPSTLVRDEIEFPGYMLESEETKILALGGKHEGAASIGSTMTSRWNPLSGN